MRWPASTLAIILALSIAGVAAAARTLIVDQAGLVFSQDSAIIARGDRIVFENHDDVTHNISVIDADGEPDDLGLQKPGVSLQYRFDRLGLFAVRCSIHPSMNMKVTVR